MVSQALRHLHSLGALVTIQMFSSAQTLPSYWSDSCAATGRGKEKFREI